MKESGKKSLYIIGSLVVLVIIMFVWKTIAVKNVKKQMEAQKIQIIDTSQRVIGEKTRYFLRLTTTTFVWAIRKEMVRENYEQINEYLNQFVKEPHVKQILVVKADGTVALATDKKLEGVLFSSLYSNDLMEINEIVVTDDKSGNILIIAPIMGLNKKLGMFFMVYEPEEITLDTSQ